MDCRQGAVGKSASPIAILCCTESGVGTRRGCRRHVPLTIRQHISHTQSRAATSQYCVCDVHVQDSCAGGTYRTAFHREMRKTGMATLRSQDRRSSRPGPTFSLRSFCTAHHERCRRGAASAALPPCGATGMEQGRAGLIVQASLLRYLMPGS